MDSDRRHQLAQNSLGNWLVTQYEDLIKPNSQLISWLTIAFLVFLCGVLLTVHMLKSNTSRAWQQYFNAFASPDPEASLQALIDSGATGPIAAQARLTFGQVLLSDAEMLLTTDKKKAEEKLEKSLTLFQAALHSTDSEEMRRQAVYGTAVACETLAGCRTGKNDLAEAEKKYKEVAERWPNSLYGQRAKKQIELLSKPETRSFYDFVASIVPETPKDDEFKVDINKKDPFVDGPAGFDPLKAIGGLDGMVPPPPTDAEEKAAEVKAPKTEETVKKEEAPKPDDSKK